MGVLLKKVRLNLIIFLSVLLLATGGCFIVYHAFSKQDSVSFEACVLTRQKNSSLLVYKKDTHAADRLCTVNIKDVSITGTNGKPVAAGSIEPGQMVQVTAGGTVLAVYPAIYHTVYHINVLNEKNGTLYDEGKKESAKLSVNASS